VGWQELDAAGIARLAYLVFGRPAAHNVGAMLPAASGMLPPILAHLGSQMAVAYRLARRVSISALLCAPDIRPGTRLLIRANPGHDPPRLR
jgi:hypothetical protein